MFKKTVSRVLGPLPCSRTPSYAPLVKAPAALLNGLFEHPVSLWELFKCSMKENFPTFEFHN
jgi:hypothetical protein